MFVGKLSDKAIDFVAKKNDRLTYYQVTATMENPDTFACEILPLRMINDNRKTIILILDKMTLGNYDGIWVNSLLDRLVDENSWWYLSKTQKRPLV